MGGMGRAGKMSGPAGPLDCFSRPTRSVVRHRAATHVRHRAAPPPRRAARHRVVRHRAAPASGLTNPGRAGSGQTQRIIKTFLHRSINKKKC